MYFNMDKTILVIDVGNTNTVFALVNNDGIYHKWRMSTSVNRTSDEYETHISAYLSKISNFKIDDVVISSVVPSINYELQSFVLRFFNIIPKLVGDTIHPNIDISLERPDEVGADRLVNSLAANKIYGGPIIVVDFGTATTFDIVSKEGIYIGGIISPGVYLSMDALDKATARLPRIAIAKPDRVIGDSTISAMQSGIFWGYISLLEGVIHKIKKENNIEMKVVATGGLSKLFNPHTNVIDFIDEDLTLKGIALTWSFELDIFSE
jgi:type III pantothenate kinase